MTMEGSAKIVNFITMGAGSLMLGHGYMSHFSEYASSSILSIYTHHIDCYCIMLIKCYFPMPLFYDVAADMQI